MGFFAGLLVASIFTILTFLGLLKFSLNKIYKATEYIIIFFGASMVKNGVKKVLEIQFNFYLEKILPLTFRFLPEKKTFFGHFLNNFFGVEKNFSLIYLVIIIAYFYFVKKILIKKSKLE